MNLTGKSLIGSNSAASSSQTFQAFDPSKGVNIEPDFHFVSVDDVNRAASLAAEAFPTFRDLSSSAKSSFLNTIAEEIEKLGDTLTQRAMAETGLPEARIKGETARTTGQLRLFAKLVEEGSWVQARIDEADADRQPLPKPDVRSMLRPLGPVAVFGASNFPLAFSVAGGDTASAFAAGCPVIVKAHGSHPGTAELVGRAVQAAVRKCGLPEGVFSMIFGSGREVGTALVEHPEIKAVGFTGSRGGGTALMKLAAEREVPIPVYAEMSSINPMLILPSALASGEGLAAGLAGSITLGVGQFCTNPGLILLQDSPEADQFVKSLAEQLKNAASGVMLNPSIAEAYQSGVERLEKHPEVEVLTAQSRVEGSICSAWASLFEVKAETFINDQSVAEEVFGPESTIVRYRNEEELLRVIDKLEGQLTGCVHGSTEEFGRLKKAIDALENKVGRLIYNGFPTGVEVCHSIIHGGPYPSTSDGRSTSVGTHAIERFCRLVCYQAAPEEMLPDELKNENPLNILRLINGEWER